MTLYFVQKFGVFKTFFKTFFNFQLKKSSKKSVKNLQRKNGDGVLDIFMEFIGAIEVVEVWLFSSSWSWVGVVVQRGFRGDSSDDSNGLHVWN